jgi:DNA-directed RNA polymerase subunit M/transcription elongation factor TFIIS
MAQSHPEDDDRTELIDKTPQDTPVPVEADCPECESGDTVTSAFAAKHADDLDGHLSCWCEDCGYGWNTQTEVDA